MQIILLTIILLFIAVGALAIRIFLVKDGKFSGGSCKSVPGKDGMTCGCGKPEGSECENTD
jgi:hypothetical protein